MTESARAADLSYPSRDARLSDRTATRCLRRAHNVIGIATCYRLDGPGVRTGKEQEIFFSSYLSYQTHGPP